MTPLLSSIDRINAALEAAVAQPPPPTGTLRVCHATEDEWNAFADSEDQIVRPNFLEWFADTEEIHIIEFARTPHEKYAAELSDQFRERQIKRWLAGYLAAENPRGEDGAQTLALDHAKQLRAPCFHQVFQYLTIFGRLKLKWRLSAVGDGTRTTRPQGDINMGYDARS
ncbi:unnamed protein product [Phytophthora lilii]|uniref:Unnamed protein product n=1 Tax=Phytophthora lilii TaxID=2077276 RepID=A0A9W6U1W4_9STRA|nr:unnamed protein product [Phytophthora lilii]